MPSPPVDEASIASTSTSTQEAPAQSSSASRSLLSFWGNGAGPSQPAPAGASAAPKRRKKKADDGAAQARIDLRAGGGSTWSIQKAEPVPAPGATAAKGKGKAKEGGEADEMKAMAKKAKQAAKPKGRKRGKASNGDGAEHEEEERAMSLGNSGSTLGEPASQQSTASGPKPSPAKRKRATKARVTAGSTSGRSTSPVIVTIPSSDPPEPTSPEAKLPATNASLKVSHPFFSRTNSTASKGAADDPIDIDQTPKKLGPKKLVFAADTKAAHPLFARVAATDGSDVVEAAEGGSASQGNAAGSGASSKVHAFFNGAGGGPVPGKLKNGWGGGVKEGEEPSPVWPGGIWPIHDGTQRIHDHAATGKIPRRSKHSPAEDGAVTPFWTSVLRDATQQTNGYAPSIPTIERMSVPPYIASHPAIASVKRRKLNSNRETWAERYRPIAAAEVLGNEVESVYLRDWLQALSVGASSGTPRKVVRKVNKAKSQLVEGWIVDDAGLFGDAVEGFDEEEEEVEHVEYEEPDFALGGRPDSYPDLAAVQLTNTMLLTGGNGTGKSAAVHAAATELGWEVFEVYPGMGKRTGGNLMSWVGDVGKNHLVVKGGRAEKPKPKENGLKSFFGGAAKRKRDEDDDPIMLTGSQGSMNDPIQIEESPREEKEIALDMPEKDSAVRQSLILIDEADLLYAEEATFWPAVISLIAESRRPVIITCNDPSRIPIESLPLQAILHFHAPPSYLAIPYLEAVAAQEGLTNPLAGAEIFNRCVRRTFPILDQPLPPNGNEPLPSFDLRSALMQMQVDRAHSEVKPSRPRREAHHDPFVAAEIASWADAFIAPRYRDVIDTCEIDRHEPSPDDVVGIHALIKPDIHDQYRAIPAYNYSSSIAATCLDLAGTPSLPHGDLQTAQTTYVRSLLPLLDPLIPLSAPLLPTSTLFTLYMPSLQGMVECDDILESEDAEAIARGEGRVNRKTGRPKRTTVGGGTGYGRYLDLPAAALEGARRSKLVWTE